MMIYVFWLILYIERAIYWFIYGARRRGVPPTLPPIYDFIYVFNPIDTDALSDCLLIDWLIIECWQSIYKSELLIDIFSFNSRLLIVIDSKCKMYVTMWLTIKGTHFLIDSLFIKKQIDTWLTNERWILIKKKIYQRLT